MSPIFRAIMQKPLVLLLLPVLTQSAARIVGGRDASATDFPYQLSLRLHGTHICGAAILTPKLAVTAAHCLPKPGPFSVKAGVTDIRDPGVVSHVNVAMVHPDFDPTLDDYDIALLMLNSSLDFSEKIKPVQLPTKPVKEGMVGVVSGWGVTFPSGKGFENNLQWVEVPVTSWKTCEGAYFGQVTKRMFCAGSPTGGKDACQGDSGGPFVVKGVLYGIVSSGVDCARPDYPGVYTDVEKMRGFIKEYGGL